MAAAMFLSPGACDARNLANRRFPLKALCEFAGAVLDADTGEMLEYRQLIKSPKHRQDWGYSFGNKIGRLA